VYSPFGQLQASPAYLVASGVVPSYHDFDFMKQSPHRPADPQNPLILRHAIALSTPVPISSNCVLFVAQNCPIVCQPPRGRRVIRHNNNPHKSRRSTPCTYSAALIPHIARLLLLRASSAKSVAFMAMSAHTSLHFPLPWFLLELIVRPRYLSLGMIS
jgi:hypothetical protein